MADTNPIKISTYYGFMYYGKDYNKEYVSF